MKATIELPDKIKGSDLAYGAKQYGFKLIADEDVAGAWEFDTVLVVQDPEGKMWAARDSGCSCPCPFEHKTWPTDWLKVRKPADIDGLIGGEEAYRWDSAEGAIAKQRLHTAIKDALRRTK